MNDARNTAAGPAPSGWAGLRLAATSPEPPANRSSTSDADRLAERAIVLSGRPARIVAVVPLPGKRGQRSAGEIDRLAAELAAAAPVGAVA